MDVEVGSNLYQNSDGMIEIEGVPQIEIALNPSTNALLINFALFDQAGVMKAKLVDSTLMFNDQRTYEVTKDTTRVTLTHVDSRDVVLQMEVKKPNVVSLTKGRFYSVKGHLLEVSPTEWKIEKRRSSGLTEDVKGGAIKLG
ncbi:hypothetical protein [Petrachloros mirabilis]